MFFFVGSVILDEKAVSEISCPILKSVFEKCSHVFAHLNLVGMCCQEHRMYGVQTWW